MEMARHGSKTFHMMDWKTIPAFLAVARHGSLRAAADHLGGTHATLRRQIETLEAGCGTQLFRRAQDGLHLTPAGKILLPEALEAEAALLKGFSAVQGLDREASGRIRLSVDPMTAHFLLAPVLSNFSRLYPDIDLDLQLSFDIESISKLEADVSIRHVIQVEEDVVGRKLFPLSIGVYASRDYIDRALPKAGPKGQGLEWIGYGPEPMMRDWIKESGFANARIRHSVPDPEMHLHLARQGVGMTFLASWVQSEYPELQRVPGSQLDHSRSTWVLLHGDLRRVRRVRLFVDYLCAALLERRADFIQG